MEILTIFSLSYRIMDYFHIKQKNGRKSVFRVYKTDYKKCVLVQGFPNEDAARAYVKQLNTESHVRNKV